MTTKKKKDNAQPKEAPRVPAHAPRKPVHVDEKIEDDAAGNTDQLKENES